MMKMSKKGMLYVVVMCVLGMLLGMSTVQAGSIALDEDFEQGTIFANQGGDGVATGTEQGANIFIDPASTARPTTGNPVTFTNNPVAGGIVNLNPGGTMNAYKLNAGQSLQIGTMNGTTLVNGNLPNWSDGNVVVQSALAVPPSVAALAPGTVAGSFEITFDARGITGSPFFPGYPLRHQKFELRVNTSSAVDVWSIDTTTTKVVLTNAMDGTNWANCTFVDFCRGMAVDTANPLHKQWTPTNLGGTAEHKGPTSDTVMVTTADQARVSIFVSGNDALQTYSYQSNADGRHGDGIATEVDAWCFARVTGVKWTAGPVPLFIDNVFMGDTRWANVGANHRAVPGNDDTTPKGNPAWNWHRRLNAFTAPDQPVESVAGVNHWWEIY